MPLIVTPRQLNQRAELYHQLGMMITAGLSVHKSLEHLHSNPPSYDLRPPIAHLLASLNQGLTVGESVQRLGKWTPSFDIALIEAGERSGRLDACFKLLATYYRERAEMAKQMISDSLYPLLVLNVAIVLFPFIEFIRTWNVPRFLFMIAIIAVPVYGAIFLIIFASQGRHGEAWRSKLEEICSYVPVLGTARHCMALARLSMALESLINAGVPIITAWELAGTASGSPALNRRIKSWSPQIENGASYSDVVSKSREFPELFANLYHTGEVSGTTDQTLVRLHNLYQTEGQAKMKALSQWTPKLMYFGIMIFVAYKIISFYTGYFKELNQVMDFK
jgi:type II secretory pathway component PulF